MVICGDLFIRACTPAKIEIFPEQASTSCILLYSRFRAYPWQIAERQLSGQAGAHDRAPHLSGPEPQSARSVRGRLDVLQAVSLLLCVILGPQRKSTLSFVPEFHSGNFILALLI